MLFTPESIKKKKSSKAWYISQEHCMNIGHLLVQVRTDETMSDLTSN